MFYWHSDCENLSFIFSAGLYLHRTYFNFIVKCVFTLDARKSQTTHKRWIYNIVFTEIWYYCLETRDLKCWVWLHHCFIYGLRHSLSQLPRLFLRLSLGSIFSSYYFTFAVTKVVKEHRVFNLADIIFRQFFIVISWSLWLCVYLMTTICFCFDGRSDN